MSDTDTDNTERTGYLRQEGPTDTSPEAVSTAQKQIMGGGSPAPGQFGAKQRTPGGFGSTPPPPSPDPTPDEQNVTPYGFRPLARDSAPPFTPYVPTGQNPALRDRAAHEWGTKDWVRRSMDDPYGTPGEGMYVPREHDLPGIFHNFVMQVGRWGPPGVAMPAIAGGRFYGTAMNMYAKGMVQQANMNRQNALASFEITQLRLREYLQKAGNIYSEYGPGDKDPGQPDRLHEELGNLAREYGDSNMMGMLDRGDYGAIDKLMKHLDSNLSDVSKATKAVQLEIEKEKLKQLKEKGAQTEADEKAWLGDKTPSAAPAAKPGEPAQPAPAPGQPALPSETADTEAPPTMPLAPTKAVSDAAMAEQLGEKPNVPKGRPRVAVDQYRQALEDYQRKIAHNKKMTDDQKMAAIRATNPGIADRVEGLRSGREIMTDKTSTTPGFELASTILGAMDPDWTSHAQKLKEQRAHAADMAELGGLRGDLTQQERTHSQMKDILLKNKQDMDLAVKLAKGLKAHGKLTDMQLVNQWELEGREKLSNDPEVAAYQLQMREIRSDIGKILTNSGPSGAGTLAVATQHEMEKLLPSGATPEMLEAQSRVLKRDYANKIVPIGDEINDLRKQIHRIGGTEFTAKDAVDDSELVKDITAEETRVIKDKDGKPKKYWLRIDTDGKAKWYDE